MKIAIDLSPLQGPHRMRGIGYTILHFINNIAPSDRKNNSYIFYVLPISKDTLDPFELLDLKGIKYELRMLKKKRRFSFKLPGKFKYVTSVMNQLLELKDLYFGDSRIDSLKNVDVFLQCDQSQSLPKKHRNCKNTLIIYDIIPYVLEWDYLWSYKTARHIKNYSRRGALRCYARRWLYVHKLKINTRRAHSVLSISQTTANDFKKNLSVNSYKITVVPLGIPEHQPHIRKNTPKLEKYEKTSWGYIPRTLELNPEIPFLLFVGGADRRRKIEDLVAAFNMIRAQDIDIKLVLSGDCMQGPDNIATEEIQSALKKSSYIDDIIFMGFASDEVREWLYQNTLAFVFPSKYEGFGLPILEAMRYGTPVITYKNSSIPEVAGNAAIYAEDFRDIATYTKQLLNKPEMVKKYNSLGKKQAAKFSWEKTSQQIINLLES